MKSYADKIVQDNDNFVHASSTFGFSYCLPMLQRQIASIACCIDEFRTNMIVMCGPAMDVVVKFDATVTAILCVFGNVFFSSTVIGVIGFGSFKIEFIRALSLSRCSKNFSIVRGPECIQIYSWLYSLTI